MIQQQRRRKRRRRKQPTRRMNASTAISTSNLNVPGTARRRRRRNNRLVPAAIIDGVKRFVFSARWISLLLLAMSVGALVLVGMDENFYLTTIPVEGAVSIPPAEIVGVSGLGSAHIFAADPKVAAERITEIPGIIAANVTLEWPNQVSIAVQEDTPVAIWLEGGQRFWITDSGKLIPARSNQPGLLLIESEMPLVAAGLDEDGTAKALAEAPKSTLSFVPKEVLAGALQLRELRPNIEKLYYRPSSGLSYEDGRGWRSHFGVGTDMQQKLAVYESIVEELLARELAPSLISVSNQDKPYYLAR